MSARGRDAARDGAARGFAPMGLDALPANARERNGEYRGTLEVRILPPGVSGLDLSVARKGKPERGQIWVRGAMRVRIVTTAINSVTYHELARPFGKRCIPRNLFLRTSLPEVL